MPTGLGPKSSVCLSPDGRFWLCSKLFFQQRDSNQDANGLMVKRDSN